MRRFGVDPDDMPERDADIEVPRPPNWGGFRLTIEHLELWVGPMFGPRSVRRIPQTEPDERLLTTFMLGFNLSWDAWK